MTDKLRERYDAGGWGRLGISFELFIEHETEAIPMVGPPKELSDRVNEELRKTSEELRRLFKLNIYPNASFTEFTDNVWELYRRSKEEETYLEFLGRLEKEF